MESRATLAARNPSPLASTRARVGPSAARLPGSRRRMRGARLVASGALGRRSVSSESKLSWELGEGGVGTNACGEHWWSKNALARIYGFGDFGVTTSFMRAFRKKLSGIESFLGKDHDDEDDEEEEGWGRGGRINNDDDDTTTTTTTTDDEDEEDTTTTDEEDTTDDEDDDDDDDERECDD